MPEPFLQTIVEAVARQYSVEPRGILSKDRHKSLSVARHTAMYVARLAGHFSFPQIGEAFNRNHTSVMTACKKMALRAASDAAYERKVTALVLEVQGLGLTGGPVKIRAELLGLVQKRVDSGIYGKTVEDEVDRILCEHFQRAKWGK